MLRATVLLLGVSTMAAAAAAEAPYGTWASPLTAAQVSRRAGTNAETPQIDRGRVYWLERRNDESGRVVLVERAPDGTVRDVTPAPYSVHTTLSDYGGGDYLVQDGTVYFSNASDQRLYMQRVDAKVATPLTPDDKSRWAACTLDAPHKQLFCTHEVYGSDPTEPTNGIAVVPLEPAPGTAGGNGPRWVFQKTDFAANPKVDAKGTRLAFVTWSHPNMSWDASELRVARIGDDGKAGDAEIVAGGKEAISDVRWLRDGTLVYASDRDGYANLYALKDGRTRQVTALNADIGGGVSAQGRSNWGPVSDQEAIALATEKGRQRLLRVDLKTGATRPFDLPSTTMRSPAIGHGLVAFTRGMPTESSALVVLDLKTNKTTTLPRGGAFRLDPALVSTSVDIEFPAKDGHTSYGFYYAPTNPDFTAPAGELPPLIVLVHGGPTSSTTGDFNPGIQYWTSRGFAVVDVNYGGSTGYGTAYRRRLNGKWGVVDVDDACSAAEYLVAQKKADPKRLIIMGGSAGGYTTLAAMAFRDVFAAGVDLFGVSDLKRLDLESHKLEKNYTFSLIGRGPEAEQRYKERAPIEHVDNIKRPLIIYQGLEDKVVPPNQSSMIFEAVKKNGVPVAYVTYANEGHGFHVPENIQHTLETELYFFGKVFGFTPAEPVQNVPIENLPAH
ncbi:MAG: dipeptidyl aminopeptidase/acylaminoacyl peptidase [Rhodospirillales bacterium]|nr:dipeptidyl aminopeptidase/acylaminoacyl peptidase [Rhodospirillales bacterium]